MSFSDLLKKGYLDWINHRGEPAPQAEFAMQIGVSPTVFNKHLLGRNTPRQGEQMIDRYYEWFGPAAYTELGLMAPEYHHLIQMLDQIPPAQRPVVVHKLIGLVKSLNVE